MRPYTMNQTMLLSELAARPDLLPPPGSVPYQPVPYEASQASSGMTWRVRFLCPSDPSRQFGLDINGDVVLGRRMGEDAAVDLIDLSPYGAVDTGVSRRHVLLRPTPTNLYLIDLGSTNGTMRSGHPVGPNTPYSLVDGDVITLGRLSLLVNIVHRPSLSDGHDPRKLELSDALTQIARAITAQLNLDDVLNQVAETAQSLTRAGATAIWLVDEESGELILEAERGLDDAQISRTSLSAEHSPLLERVLRDARPVRTSRGPGEAEIKMKTGLLVEALVYVPITLGGVTFGVLSATHRHPGKRFDRRDEQLLEAIADFAAIAIQNARLYQRTDAALAERVKELAALNGLSAALSRSLDLAAIYKVLQAHVNRHWPVERVGLYLVQEKEKRLCYYNGNGINAESGWFAMGMGVVGCVARDGQPLAINGVEENDTFVPRLDAPDVAQPRSLACVPLRAEERTVGVLTLVNKRGGPFSEEDLERLQAHANPIAMAVENARLYAESERQRSAIQMTARILPQPLLILDESGNSLISNGAAQRLLQRNMSALFAAISRSVGRTIEATIDDETYLATTEHIEDVGTIMMMQDITYVKRLQQERAEFMHTLSHDMRNPLTSIIGYTEVLKRQLNLEGDQALFLERIGTGANQMLAMVNRLLESIDDDSAIQLEQNPCALEEIAQRAVQDLEGVALQKRISVKMRVEGEPYQLLADEERLYHALLNLIENAIKYAPPETRVDVMIVFADSGVSAAVLDEGPGLAEEDLPRVFDKFFRGTRTLDKPGTGLGLAVVRHNVEAHDGSVFASNRKEKGAIFKIALPASLRVPDKPAPEDEAPPPA